MVAHNYVQRQNKSQHTITRTQAFKARFEALGFGFSPTRRSPVKANLNASAPELLPPSTQKAKTPSQQVKLPRREDIELLKSPLRFASASQNRELDATLDSSMRLSQYFQEELFPRQNLFPSPARAARSPGKMYEKQKSARKSACKPNVLNDSLNGSFAFPESPFEFGNTFSSTLGDTLGATGASLGSLGNHTMSAYAL